MASIYHRPSLAREMAKQMLEPGPLDEGLRSGLFLSGGRRTGKTTFLINDLIPALEKCGALAIYVDLWVDVSANPSSLIRTAVVRKLKEISSPRSTLLQRLKGIRATEVEGLGLNFAFELNAVGTANGETLAYALGSLVDQAKLDVVLIVDEVQQVITTQDGKNMLFALKAARDAVNLRPETPGHFILLGVGSHHARVNELAAGLDQAFAGATIAPYPVLGKDFIANLLSRLPTDQNIQWPSLEVTYQAFQTLGCRPEEIIHALKLPSLQAGGDTPADQALPLIAATLRSAAAANLDIDKPEKLPSPDGGGHLRLD